MSSDKVKKELKELLKDPDNRYCADCPIKGPTWASVNIGVWICMPCSGIHRSLGTHITQVRSVDLDKWKPEWVEVMKQWGNVKANTVWEAKMPKGYEGKPNETEAQELTQKLQKFIRDKYEKKKWFSETAMKKLTKKDASDSGDEDEEAEEEDDEVEEKPKKKSTSSSAAPAAAATTTKKPLIVMKQPASSSAKQVPAKAQTVAEPDTLLDSFDPFGDSSFTPSFPSMASTPATTATMTMASSSVASSSNPFGDVDFVSAPAPAAASPPAAPKPAFDLSSLYGMSSQPQQQQQQSWGMPTTQGAYPGYAPQQQRQQPFGGGFAPQQQQGFPQMMGGFSGQPQQQQQPMQGGGQVMIGGFSFPALPTQPQQQQQQQPMMMMGFPQQQQQQQPSQMWGGMMPPPQSGGQQQGRPAAGSASDPFSGLM